MFYRELDKPIGSISETTHMVTLTKDIGNRINTSKPKNRQSQGMATCAKPKRNKQVTEALDHKTSIKV